MAKPNAQAATVFSPHQVYAGAFLGGPLAGVYLLYANFKEMNQPRLSKVTAAVGLMVTVMLVYLAVVLPDDFSFFPVNFAYAGLAAGIAWYFQVSSEELQVSERYSRASHWAVAKVVALSLVMSFALVILVLLAFDAMFNGRSA